MTNTTKLFGIGHIFFDLDDTLWDHRRNQEQALRLVCQGLDLPVEFNEYHKIYHEENEKAWSKYRHGDLTSEEVRIIRFQNSLARVGIQDPFWAQRADLLYREIYPRQTHLQVGVHHTLSTLVKHFPLGLITNGFRSSQETKLVTTGLKKYFTYLIYSEDIGKTKPRPEIFRHALDLAKTAASKALYIGDDFNVDIVPAAKEGWKTVYFLPHEPKLNCATSSPIIPDATIKNLTELLPLLIPRH